MFEGQITDRAEICFHTTYLEWSPDRTGLG